MGTVAELRLRHFRNYTALDLSFDDGISVFVGDNGEGKTNLLEGVYYLALLRSFRCHRVRALQQWGADGFYAAARLRRSRADATGPGRIEVSFGERRKLRVDGQDVSRTSDFINQFLCVALAPEDIALVKGAAGERRRFLDILLSQLDPSYLAALREFTSALKARNVILREIGRYGESSLAAYDDLVVRHGAAVTAARAAFVEELAECMNRDLVPALAPPVKPVQIEYQSAVTRAAGKRQDKWAFAEAYGRILARTAERDRREGHTTRGPHRDDLGLSLAGEPLSEYGSEGQCRIVSLMLRLAAGDLLLNSSDRKEEVVFLVDDVMGELDPTRQEAFFRALSRRGRQIFLACTEIPSWLPDEAAIYHVQRGTVTRP